LDIKEKENTKNIKEKETLKTNKKINEEKNSNLKQSYNYIYFIFLSIVIFFICIIIGKQFFIK
jgi:hypothetical protein